MRTNERTRALSVALAPIFSLTAFAVAFCFLIPVGAGAGVPGVAPSAVPIPHQATAVAVPDEWVTTNASLASVPLTSACGGAPELCFASPASGGSGVSWSSFTAGLDPFVANHTQFDASYGILPGVIQNDPFPGANSRCYLTGGSLSSAPPCANWANTYDQTWAVQADPQDVGRLAAMNASVSNLSLNGEKAVSLQITGTTESESAHCYTGSYGCVVVVDYTLPVTSLGSSNPASIFPTLITRTSVPMLSPSCAHATCGTTGEDVFTVPFLANGSFTPYEDPFNVSQTGPLCGYYATDECPIPGVYVPIINASSGALQNGADSGDALPLINSSLKATGSCTGWCHSGAMTLNGAGTVFGNGTSGFSASLSEITSQHAGFNLTSSPTAGCAGSGVVGCIGGSLTFGVAVILPAPHAWTNVTVYITGVGLLSKPLTFGSTRTSTQTAECQGQAGDGTLRACQNSLPSCYPTNTNGACYNEWTNVTTPRQVIASHPDLNACSPGSTAPNSGLLCQNPMAVTSLDPSFNNGWLNGSTVVVALAQYASQLGNNSVPACQNGAVTAETCVWDYKFGLPITPWVTYSAPTQEFRAPSEPVAVLWDSPEPSSVAYNFALLGNSSGGVNEVTRYSAAAIASGARIEVAGGVNVVNTQYALSLTNPGGWCSFVSSPLCTGGIIPPGGSGGNGTTGGPVTSPATPWYDMPVGLLGLLVWEAIAIVAIVVAVGYAWSRD
ncbi:MAG: hypothetical protein KGI98_14570 [Euryarchaeota archaeon]|nr:hypothetical protein [Euryarchaeota archaeon]MDE1881169.1 hypothetical protein [Euryarchaeota archaeon]